MLSSLSFRVSSRFPIGVSVQHFATFPRLLEHGTAAKPFESTDFRLSFPSGYRFSILLSSPDYWDPALPGGAPSGTRTPDPLIKSQLLYQLS